MGINGHIILCEDYVSFEVAKLLKEKGFDIPCDNYYDSLGKTPNESVYGGVYIETLDYNTDPFVKSGFPKFKTFSAPIQSIAMKWLREVHKINLHLVPFYGFNGEYTDNCKWIYGIDFKNKGISLNYPKFNSYEEACEAAIKYCLTNLI